MLRTLCGGPAGSPGDAAGRISGVLDLEPPAASLDVADTGLALSVPEMKTHAAQVGRELGLGGLPPAELAARWARCEATFAEMVRTSRARDFSRADETFANERFALPAETADTDPVVVSAVTRAQKAAAVAASFR